MKRREFITLLGWSAAFRPFAVRAQQMGRLPTIGFLAANASVWKPWTAAFVARLHDLGWIEGRTIHIEYRWWEGRAERAAQIARELVDLKVDLIVANADAVPAVKQATAVIPIVFVLSQDPIGSGLVGSLADPAATSRGCRSNRPIWQVSDLNSCARLFLALSRWRSSEMLRFLKLP